MTLALLLQLVLLIACGGIGDQVPSYTGTVEITEVDVSPVMPGRIEQVLVHEGDQVQAGQVLFTLETEALELELQARKAAMEQARAAVATTTAQYQAAQAQVATLERELERMQSLEEAGAGTAQQTSQLQGQFDVANAQAKALKQGIDQARAVVAQAETAIDGVKKKLRECQVQAPMDAVVLSRNREPGEVSTAGMSVLTIGDLQHPRLRVYVPLTTVEDLSIGDSVEVTLDAGSQKVHQGKIRWISSQAEFTPRDILTPEERVKQVFAVDIALEPAPGIHPGIPADAVFHGASAQ